MRESKRFAVTAACILVLAGVQAAAQSVSIKGGPEDTRFNVGTVARFGATAKNLTGGALPDRLIARIQYAGGSTLANVPMVSRGTVANGETVYEGQWMIPADARTGLYWLLASVAEEASGKAVSWQRLRSFAVYRKVARIVSVGLDKTFYAVGDPIQCEVVVENLTDHPLDGLRVEFSNPNYPWIATFSGEASLSGQKQSAPELALTTLRQDVSLAARARLAIPMTDVGTAAFLQGTQKALLGAGAPPRHEKNPLPEVDRYTVSLWNRQHTVLYDMQFSPTAIVRAPGETLPKPYSDSYTHPYNDEIDFVKYRQFYSPGEISNVIRVDHSHALYRPGEPVVLNLQIRNPGSVDWHGMSLRVEAMNSQGERIAAGKGLTGVDVPAGHAKRFSFTTWTPPATAPPAVYFLVVSAWTADGREQAQTRFEIAVNQLPGPVLVFCPHEDDEWPWAGLTRAAIETKIPVHVVFFTGGDVGECERYYGKPCGPNEAREFGTVRMEESREALGHIGLGPANITFLGLPDGGSQEIWFHHITAADPYLSVYLASDHAPYENILQVNLPYARDPVIDVLKKIITEYHPALIATPHPDERHVDHRTANWFVVKACQELLREHRLNPAPIILADQVYGSGGFRPAPYHYQKWTVHLSGEVAALKQEMSWIYQSQDGNLAEGAKKTFDELPRAEVHYRILDWQEHEGWNEQGVN